MSECWALTGVLTGGVELFLQANQTPEKQKKSMGPSSWVPSFYGPSAASCGASGVWSDGRGMAFGNTWTVLFESLLTHTDRGCGYLCMSLCKVSIKFYCRQRSFLPAAAWEADPGKYILTWCHTGKYFTMTDLMHHVDHFSTLTGHGSRNFQKRPRGSIPTLVSARGATWHHIIVAAVRSQESAISNGRPS